MLCVNKYFFVLVVCVLQTLCYASLKAHDNIIDEIKTLPKKKQSLERQERALMNRLVNGPDLPGLALSSVKRSALDFLNLHRGYATIYPFMHGRRGGLALGGSGVIVMMNKSMKSAIVSMNQSGSYNPVLLHLDPEKLAIANAMYQESCENVRGLIGGRAKELDQTCQPTDPSAPYDHIRFLGGLRSKEANIPHGFHSSRILANYLYIKNKNNLIKSGEYSYGTPSCSILETMHPDIMGCLPLTRGIFPSSQLYQLTGSSQFILPPQHGAIFMRTQRPYLLFVRGASFTVQFALPNAQECMGMFCRFSSESGKYSIFQ